MNSLRRGVYRYFNQQSERAEAVAQVLAVLRDGMNAITDEQLALAMSPDGSDVTAKKVKDYLLATIDTRIADETTKSTTEVAALNVESGRIAWLAGLVAASATPPDAAAASDLQATYTQRLAELAEAIGDAGDASRARLGVLRSVRQLIADTPLENFRGWLKDLKAAR